jgi:hypothetical protein
MLRTREGEGLGTLGGISLLTKEAKPFESCRDVKDLLFVIVIQDLNTFRVISSLELFEGDRVGVESTSFMEKIHHSDPIKKTTAAQESGSTGRRGR